MQRRFTVEHRERKQRLRSFTSGIDGDLPCGHGGQRRWELRQGSRSLPTGPIHDMVRRTASVCPVGRRYHCNVSLGLRREWSRELHRAAASLFRRNGRHLVRWQALVRPALAASGKSL